jgi:hypothetical protein
MASSWELQLTIDAHSGDDFRVRPRQTHPEGAAHLTVRVGPLLIYCLDGAAVTSMAAAWAQAHASTAHLLPLRGSKRPPARPEGVVVPVAEVVADGSQRWDITAPRPGQPFATVTSKWLTVRVHDLPALQTHVHAWATACDLGQRLLPTPPLTFDRLLTNAQMVHTAHEYGLDHPMVPGSERGRSR